MPPKRVQNDHTRAKATPLDKWGTGDFLEMCCLRGQDHDDMEDIFADMGILSLTDLRDTSNFAEELATYRCKASVRSAVVAGVQVLQDLHPPASYNLMRVSERKEALAEKPKGGKSDATGIKHMKSNASKAQDDDGDVPTKARTAPGVGQGFKPMGRVAPESVEHQNADDLAGMSMPVGRTATMPELSDTDLHVLMDLASEDGFDEVLQILNKYPDKVNAVRPGGQSGWTVLHHAAYHGNESAAKALLKMRADPTTKDAEGNTAMEVAMEYGSNNVVKLLGRGKTS